MLISKNDTPMHGTETPVTIVRGDFLAAASHELKTPVAGIELLAGTLRMAIEDGNTEAALELCVTLGETARHLRELVGDLLDFSQIESATSSKDIADVRATIERSLVPHSIGARAEGVRLSAELEGIGADDVMVAIAPTQLTIILDNLIDNALAYTDTGSVRIALRCGITAVTIDVIDTGIGIAPEELDKIFERFYAIDENRSRANGGTGLGLALVKQAVEKAGGTIAVSSTPGLGSTFSVMLPRVG